VWLISGVAPDVFFRYFDIFNSVFFSCDVVALVCILVITRKTLAEGVRDKRGMTFKFRVKRKKSEKNASGKGFSFSRLFSGLKFSRKNSISGVGHRKGTKVAPENSDTVTSRAAGASTTSKRGSGTNAEYSGDTPTMQTPTSFSRRFSEKNLSGKNPLSPRSAARRLQSGPERLQSGGGSGSNSRKSSRLLKEHRHSRKSSRRGSESMRVENLHLQPILHPNGNLLAHGSLTIDFDDSNEPKRKRRLLANYAKLVNTWQKRSQRSRIADPDAVVGVLRRGSISVLGASSKLRSGSRTSRSREDLETSISNAQSAVDIDSDMSADGMDDIVTSNVAGDAVIDAVILARRRLHKKQLSRIPSNFAAENAKSGSTSFVDEPVWASTNGQLSRTRSTKGSPSKGSPSFSRLASTADEPVLALTKTSKTPEAPVPTTTMRTSEVRKFLLVELPDHLSFSDSSDDSPASSPRSRRVATAAAIIKSPVNAQHDSNDEDSGHSGVKYDEDGFLVDNVVRAHRGMSASTSANSSRARFLQEHGSGGWR
jgi:hypothetical protein